MTRIYPNDSKILFPTDDDNCLLFTVGDFVTDGRQVYVLGRDLNWHYCDSGDHANFHVSHERLKIIVGDNYCK